MMDLIIQFFLVINCVTFVLSLIDKVCAVNKLWRFPETMLLTLSFFGGAVGAKLGQIILGHKKLKVDFTASLNLIAIFQIALAGAIWSAQLRADGVLVHEMFVSSSQDAKKDEGPRRFGPGS
jgi:uncharacterized membrane protein YsdA (DUF1294 family)